MNEKIYLSRLDYISSYFIVTSFPERYIKYRPILQLEAGDMVIEESPWTKKFEYFLVGEKGLFNISMSDAYKDNINIKLGTITLSIARVVLKSGKQLTVQQLNETPELIIESH